MSLLTPPRLVIPSTRSLPLRPATQFNPHSGRRGHGLVQLILSVPSRLRRPHPSACPCDATLKMLCFTESSGKLSSNARCALHVETWRGLLSRRFWVALPLTYTLSR